MINIVIYNDNYASAAMAMRDSRGDIKAHLAGKLRKNESIEAFERRMRGKAVDGVVMVSDLRDVRCETSNVKR